MSRIRRKDRARYRNNQFARARRRFVTIVMCLSTLPLLSCTDAPEYQYSAVVTTSAYNSVSSQTAGDAHIGAWGDELKPGMKAVAVSRDLEELGLTHGVEVKIDGLDGTYRVMDRTASRMSSTVDIYMGEDVEAAREWGRKEVTIYWN